MEKAQSRGVSMYSSFAAAESLVVNPPKQLKDPRKMHSERLIGEILNVSTGAEDSEITTAWRLKNISTARSKSPLHVFKQSDNTEEDTSGPTIARKSANFSSIRGFFTINCSKVAGAGRNRGGMILIRDKDNRTKHVIIKNYYLLTNLTL